MLGFVRFLDLLAATCHIRLFRASAWIALARVTRARAVTGLAFTVFTFAILGWF